MSIFDIFRIDLVQGLIESITREDANSEGLSLAALNNLTAVNKYRPDEIKEAINRLIAQKIVRTGIRTMVREGRPVEEEYIVSQRFSIAASRNNALPSVGKRKRTRLFAPDSDEEETEAEEGPVRADPFRAADQDWGDLTHNSLATCELVQLVTGVSGAKLKANTKGEELVISALDVIKRLGLDQPVARLLAMVSTAGLSQLPEARNRELHSARDTANLMCLEAARILKRDFSVRMVPVICRAPGPNALHGGELNREDMAPAGPKERPSAWIVNYAGYRTPLPVDVWRIIAAHLMQCPGPTSRERIGEDNRLKHVMRLRAVCMDTREAVAGLTGVILPNRPGDLQFSRVGKIFPGVKTIIAEHPGLVTNSPLTSLGLRSLEHLRLGNVLTDTSVKPAWLGSFTNLRSLSVENVYDEDHEPTFFEVVGYKMPLMERLTVRSMSFGDALTVAPLTSLTRLKHLTLSHTSFDDQDSFIFLDLPTLETLDLAGNFVTDNGLQSLRGLTNLVTLGLGHTEDDDEERITDEGVGHIRTLPKLRELHLDAHILVTGKGIDTMTSLRVLSLASCGVTDSSLEFFFSLYHLTKLVLSFTEVTDVGLGHLAAVTSLEELDVTGCRGIGDYGLVSVKDMTKLKYLHANQTGVTESGIQLFLAFMRPRVVVITGDAEVVTANTFY